MDTGGRVGERMYMYMYKNSQYFVQEKKVLERTALREIISSGSENHSTLKIVLVYKHNPVNTCRSQHLSPTGKQ